MPVAQITHGPALYQLANDSVVIWWETDVNGGPNKLQWSKTGMDPVDVPAETSVVTRGDGVERFVHKVHLTDLTANTLHTYKLFAELFETPTVLAHSFRTYRDDGATIKIGVWGNNEAQPGATLPGLGNTLTVLDALGAEGYLVTGGIVEDGTSYDSWEDHWLTPMGSTRLETKSTTGTRGETDGASTVARRMWPFGGGSDFYQTHSIGKAQVAMVTSAPGFGNNSLRIGRLQGNWLMQLAQDPAWKNASYRILVVHHPFRTVFWDGTCTYGTNGTREDLLDLQELVKLTGCDLVLYGWSRSYQRGAFDSTHEDNTHVINHVVTGGGGGFKHNTRCFSWPPPEEPAILVSSSDYIGLILEISSTRLALKAYRLADSTLFDSAVIAPHTLF